MHNPIIPCFDIVRLLLNCQSVFISYVLIFFFKKRGELKTRSKEFDNVENTYRIYFITQILNPNVVCLTFYIDKYSVVILDNLIQKIGRISKLTYQMNVFNKKK